jgi:PPOX class probable F420-dependent enzyme
VTEPQVERPSMAGYGVPEKSEGTLPWAWARERLERCRNYWVGTVSASGRPHSLPVWGVWLGDDAFVFSCSPTARKLRNLRANPQVVVTVEDTVEAVSVEGVAREINGTELAERAIAQYVGKYGTEIGDTLADFLRENAIVAVEPERAFGIIEREDEFAARATRWRWVR